MREYELYVVLNAAAEEEAVSSIVERVTQLVTVGYENTRGEMTKVEARGKRRLAYVIGKATEGHDIIFTFQAPPAVLPEIERFLKLEEQALRYMLVRVGD
ncbi:MAG TPA: 30S ribosomal protein S6 [Anaerolineae bacterium]|jgi:small subunit ribosomal protein S6|nr:30S ribosomal protein S6 [Anaerolineae bacterium]